MSAGPASHRRTRASTATGSSATLSSLASLAQAQQSPATRSSRLPPPGAEPQLEPEPELTEAQVAARLADESDDVRRAEAKASKGGGSMGMGMGAPSASTMPWLFVPGRTAQPPPKPVVVSAAPAVVAPKVEAPKLPFCKKCGTKAEKAEQKFCRKCNNKF